jgi:hypothetical protein
MLCAAAAALAATFGASDASALLIEKVDGPAYTVFYPYPTAFTGVDLTSVQSVRFDYDQVASGALMISDIAFGSAP